MKNPFNKENRGEALFYISLTAAVLSLVAAFAAAAADAYIRWTINQNFTFLGGWEQEALTLGAFGLLFGLAYLSRR
ncbi:MAG TPA: hypothetical protein VHD37_02435 [Candidatus Paceibacterota bacterium]|nr:hypothetical protein [Candidatus Paceibacterota bacterium]